MGDHVSLGKDAERAWDDVVKRLRRYLESRVAAGDAEAAVQNRELLAPLHDAIAHAKAVAATRKTRRGKKAPAPGAEATG